MRRGLRVLGVSIVHAGPLKNVHIPLGPEVSVLYGLNGAGKTRILLALKAAFTGMRPKEGQVYLHLTSGELSEDKTPLSPLFTHIGRAVIDDYARLWEFQRRFSGDTSSYVDPREIGKNIPDVVLEYLALASEQEDRGLGAELANQGLFSLQPMGTTEAEWTIWLSSKIDDRAPIVSALWKDRWRYTDTRTTEEPYGYVPDDWLFASYGKETPPWVPLPFHPLETSIPLPFDWLAMSKEETTALPRYFGEDSGWDPNLETLQTLQTLSASLLETAGASDVRFDADVVTEIGRLSSTASRWFGTFLLDAPELECHLHHPEEWAKGTVLQWRAVYGEERRLPIEVLSRAELRWARLAIQLALAKSSTSDVGALVIDEPEAALHLLAEHQALRGLKAVSNELALPIICATHSTHMVNDPGVTLHHVFRNALGETQTVSLPTPTARALGHQTLGITKSQFLMLHRVFLIVEGEHDSVMIDEWLEDEIDLARARILPMRGARNLLTLVDAQFIFDFTDAQLLIALDRIRLDPIENMWSAAQQRARQGDMQGAWEELSLLREPTQDGRRREPTSEEKLLHEFGWLALQRGRSDRLALFGFSLPDIIQYLSPQALGVSANLTWKTLLKSYWRERADDEAFKAWLRNRHGVHITPPRLRKAIRAQQTVPDDFAELGRLLLRVAGVRDVSPDKF